MSRLDVTTDTSKIALRFARDGDTSSISGTETSLAEEVSPAKPVSALNSGAISALESSNLVQRDESQYPNLQGIWGWYQIGSLERIFSPTEPGYMLARATPFLYIQILDLCSPTGRSSRAAAWNALKADNPLLHASQHSVPCPAIPAYRPGFTDHSGYLYRIARDNHNRVDAACMIDTDNAATEFNGALATSYVAGGGTTFALNVVADGMRADWAKFAADALAGTDLSGFGFGKGYDLSDYMAWYHDATQLLYFGYNKKLMYPYTNGKGQVVSVDQFRDSTGTHLAKCTISTQPGSIVEGKPIYFFSNTSQKGFIGYVVAVTDPEAGIVGYKEIAGGRAELELKALPGTANGVAQIVVAAGWRYTICNPGAVGDQTCDWNRDGSPEGKINGPVVWVPKLSDLFDQIDTHVLTETGHQSARGWNAVATSWDEKWNRGWVSPHEYTAVSDNHTFENAARDVGFQPATDDTHRYDVRGSRNWLTEKTMHAIYYTKSMRKTPNSFVSGRPFRPHWETLVADGGLKHAVLDALDANALRFQKALVLTASDMMAGGVLDSANNGVACEEDFIDFDTNYSTPAPIADYNDAGGPTLAQGPQGIAVMRTPDWGEAGYARRVGDWLLLINAADVTRSDYPRYYAPSHLPGGYTPQAGNDEITAANWATIISTYLKAGETGFRHFNPATYINQRVTSWLRAQSPNHWGSGNPSGPYSYGPQQPHPNDNDGTYTLANTPALTRDPTLNNGSVVNTSVSYFFGPMQAVFLEII